METLSPELMGLICAHLAPEDIRSVRATCKSFQEKSSFDFARTHLSDMTIVGTNSKIHALTSLLSSPNIPSAKILAKKLKVYIPDTRHIAPFDNNISSAEDVLDLFKAMPSLEYLSFGGYKPIHPDDIDDDYLIYHYHHVIHREGAEVIFDQLKSWKVVHFFVQSLACLESSTSQIKALKIVECSLGGAALITALMAHERTLRTLTLHGVTLMGSQLAWSDVFRCLLRLRLTKVRFSKLHGFSKFYDCSVEQLMWLEKTQDDARNGPCCSVDHSREEKDESYRNGLALEGVGRYSKYGVKLTLGWVKKGLEKFLGIEDHTLYPCE